MLSGHSKVISATFEQNQSCVTARDRMVWTRTPTGNDSDIIFPTIGHFSGDFSNVHWTVTSHSKSFGLTPKCIRTIFERLRIISALSGKKNTHFV